MAVTAMEWEEVVAALALEPAFARVSGLDTVTMVWSADGERLLWQSRGARAARQPNLSTPLPQDASFLSSSTRDRLRTLAAGVAPRDGFRLERLRLGRRALDPLVTVACRIVSRDGEDALVTTTLDGGVKVMPPRSGPPVLPSDQTVEVDGPPDHPQVIDEEATADSDGLASPILRRGMRFTWATDREGHFTAASSGLKAAVGEQAADIEGRTWFDLVGGLVLDDDDIGAALAVDGAWSRRRVRWLDPDTMTCIPVDISGAPVRPRSGGPEGYRGFGTAFPDERVAAGAGWFTKPWRRPESDAAPVAPVVDGAAPLTNALDAAAALTGTAGDTMFGVLRAWFGPHVGSGSTISPTRPATSAPTPQEPPDVDRTSSSEGLSAPELGALDEIARALQVGLPSDPEPPDERRSAEILPFQAGGRSRETPARFLDQVPVGILVIRQGSVIYANPHLLGIFRQPDLPSLVAAGGVEEILAREPSTGEGTTVIDSARDRGLGGIDVRYAEVKWGELTATLAVVVPATPSAAVSEPSEAADPVSREGDDLSSALDIAADGVLVLDRSARILSANSPATSLFARDRADLVGDGVTALLVPEDHRAFLGTLAAVRDSGVGHVQDAEVRTRQWGGASRPLSVRVGVLGEGDAATFVAAFRDVSALKAIEADLRDARRIAESASTNRAEFLARVSHEIRTPLTAITGFADLMLDERFGPIENERYKSYIRDIHQSGGHVLSLVNDLLDLAKVTSGNSDLSPTRVDLNGVTRQCIALSGPLATRERTILRTSFPLTLPSVMADERSVRQIVLNVLTNAIRFTGAGGQVIVSTAHGPRGDIVLSVRDTGPGMTEDEIAEALMPFRQVHATRRRDGTGLGLPLSKALVEANGGVFSITSARDTGTLIEIRLPQASAETIAAE